VEYKLIIPPFREIHPDGTMNYNFTRPQLEALNSPTKNTWMLCGGQSGKSIFMPVWLQEQMQRFNPIAKQLGIPCNYLAGSTNYPLLDKQLLPYCIELFCDILHLGEYKSKGNKIVFKDEYKTTIYFFAAEKPSSMESVTAISAILDEIGQDEWKEETWNAVQNRLAIASDPHGLNAGRVLGGTTLYNFGWLKYKIYDAWLRGEKDSQGNLLHTVIHADSIENPRFSPEEYERLKLSMPEWQFNLRYRGRYTKPAGLVYDAFDSEACGKPRSESPVKPDWVRYCGMDFGDDTAAVFYAVDPATGFFYLDAIYKTRGRSTDEHVAALKNMSQGWNILKCVGGKGDPGDDGWRGDFTKAGWKVLQPAIRPVEQGIQRVYNFHKQNKLFVINDLEEYLKEKMAYSYKLDEQGNPTGEIENKQRFHLMDAERYCLSEFEPNFGQAHKLTAWRF
jgi:hypothetical protein